MTVIHQKNQHDDFQALQQLAACRKNGEGHRYSDEMLRQNVLPDLDFSDYHLFLSMHNIFLTCASAPLNISKNGLIHG